MVGVAQRDSRLSARESIQLREGNVDVRPSSRCHSLFLFLCRSHRVLLSRPVFFLSILLSVPLHCFSGTGIPAPGDPRRLTDLRWLARPPSGQTIVVDTFPDGPDRVEAGGVVADITGPGVLQHLMCAPGPELRIRVDGAEVFRGDPHQSWPRVYVAPKPDERGVLPFAFPLVHQAGLFAHCLLPIPFKSRLVVERPKGRKGVWLMAQRPAQAPETVFSTDPVSAYVVGLRAVQAGLLRRKDTLPVIADAETHESTVECRTESTELIAEFAGPGELVAMRLHVYPGALNLLRELVIGVTIDGVSTIRMPLVDFVGASHPWPHAWAPMAGDWAAGIIHPYRRSGGRVQRQVVVYAKLPIPFASELRVSLTNRSDQLPIIVRGQFVLAPLQDTRAPLAVLCGASHRVALQDGRNVLHTFPASSGRLVGTGLFTTGHGRDWAWRRNSHVRLASSVGNTIFSGPGLLPFALQGVSGNIVFGAMTWNHNSLEPVNRCGAGRHFWLDPLPVAGREHLVLSLSGADAPDRGTAIVLWYHMGDQPPPEALDEIRPRAGELPPPHHGQPRVPSNPDGWWAEAETFADSAEATVGHARAETVGAADAFASAGAYLAWNAVEPGDTLDLLVDLPPTRYVRLWYHRLQFPAGGVFKIQLAAMDEPVPELELARSPTDFRTRVLGLRAGRASIDCHGVWPHRQAYRFQMPIMHNPAPGTRGRLRFVCASKPGNSRGYLLAIDQLGIDAAPVVPPGWNSWEGVKEAGDRRTLQVIPMPSGRPDFHSWGGLQLAATTAESESTFLLFTPDHPGAGNAVVLRGAIESGSWCVTAGAGAMTPLTPGPAGKPSEWTVPLGPESDDVPLRVTARCQSRRGSLLLNAWRHAVD